MASTICLTGVSLGPTIPFYYTARRVPNELRQGHDSQALSCFLGQSGSSVSFSCFSHGAFHKWWKLRRRKNAASFLVALAGQPAAPLFYTGSAEKVQEKQREQNSGKKWWRTRRKSKSLSSRNSNIFPTEDVVVEGKKSSLAGDSLYSSFRAAESTPAPNLVEDGNSAENSGRKENATDLVPLCWQSGDPYGKRVLGRAVVKWISRGMEHLAGVVTEAEQRGDIEDVVEKLSQSGLAFVALAQPYLAENPMPLHSEALCLKASTHYPTLFDHFQRALQEDLQRLESTGVLEHWQQSQAWKLLKKHARSDGHRVVTRKSPELKEIHDDLGLTRESVSNIQRNIDMYVAHAFELLRVERDAELDATQHSLDSILGTNTSPLSEEEQLQEQLLHEDNLHAECCDTLHNLTALSSSTGLGGMHLVTLTVKGGNRLPPTALSPGDMVCVRASNHKGAGATECMRGSVYSLGEDGTSISVAVEARYGDPTFSRLFGRSLRIDRISDLADATTYQRDCQALERLQKQGLHKKNAAASIVAVLFGEGADITWLAQNAPHSLSSLEGCDTSERLDSPTSHPKDFDDSQCSAIKLGLSKHRPVVVIQGPPGTGKTKVILEIIKKVVMQGEKVLATAPTNAAVDNLVERLAFAAVNVVRVGNPARVAPAVVARSLSHIVDLKLDRFRRDVARRRADLRSDLRQCLGDESMEAGLRQMLKQLGRTLKQKEKELVDETIKQADVVLCTNTGAGDNLVRQVGPFGLVVIDEAGQAIEPSCWIPLLQGRRAVLAGDTCQLAPTILSREAMEGGLGISLMERASDLHQGILSSMLTTQYRMNNVIANWSSQEMYGGLLKSSPSVSSRLLSDSPNVQATWVTQVPLLLLDTRLAHGSLIAGCEEQMDPAGTGSFYNEGEADIVVEHVRVLLSAGVAPEEIAVQSPYVAQVQLLRDRVDGIPGGQNVQVASTDSFQGREADAVVISMVRSNRLGVVGFLGDNRRMNVAITRSCQHVAIICDSTTVGRNAFLRRLLHYIRQYGEVRCAFEGWSISGLLKGRLPTPGSS